MKVIKISDPTHAKLTGLVGQLTAESGIMQTYEDAINELLLRIAPLPKECAQKIRDFIEKNQELGYLTMEEFLKDAVRFRIEHLNNIQKQQQLGK
jgi:hypothetical protein